MMNCGTNFLKTRDGSRISGKGIHMYKAVGIRFAGLRFLENGDGEGFKRTS